MSIFRSGTDATGSTRSDVSRERETRSQNYTRTYSFDDATTQMRRISNAFEINFSISL